MEDEAEKQIGVRVNKQLWNEFRQDVRDRRGGIRGHLKTEVNNALRSYIEGSKGGDLTDRVRRLEDNVEDIADGVGTLLEDEERKNKKDSTVSATTKNRLQRIDDRINREAGDAVKVHESIVQNAIEDIAGTSRPTLNRYQEMLESRHIAHQWPKGDSSAWWVDTDKFVKVLSTTHPEFSMAYQEMYGDWWTDREQTQSREPGIE